MRTLGPKTVSFVLGLLIVLGLIDAAIRWDILPAGYSICNPGIALGLPLPMELVWIGIGIFLLITLFQVVYSAVLDERLAWGAIFIGGGINSLDRWLHGCVTDYLHVPFFPSFNLADMMLFLGVAWLLMVALGVYFKTKTYVG